MLLISNSFESKLLCLNGKKCIRRSYRKMNLRKKQKKEAKRKKDVRSKHRRCESREKNQVQNEPALYSWEDKWP